MVLTSQKNPTASHMLPTRGAKITGNVQHVQSSVAVFRARLTDQPRFKNHADNTQPPPLPRAVTV